MIAVCTNMMLVRIDDMLFKSSDMIKMPVASPAIRVVMFGEDVLIQGCLTAEVPFAWWTIARI
jgi:hypothetical protein